MLRQAMPAMRAFYVCIAGTVKLDENSRISLSGSVSQKWLKRDIGEIAWAIPGINDVQNNVTLAVRRRARGSQREVESTAAPVRKGS
jgi:hypothetical protein